MSLLKDICTLKDGQSGCLAGIASVIAIIIGVCSMAYVFFWICPTKIEDIADILKTFAIYHGSVVTSGCVGKVATNFAEPTNGS